MAKREQTAIETSIQYDPEGAPIGLCLDFAHGEVIRINHGQLAGLTALHAMYHGLKQKMVDAAAISRNEETGASATIEDKYAAVRKVYDRLLAGEWNAKRGGDGAGSGGLLFKALARMYPTKTAEQLREYLDGLDKAQQASLRANPKVAAIIEEIKAASAGNGVDSDALLAGLED